MILVTGPTGTVGRLVLEQLPAHCTVRALARDPSRISVARAGLETVRGHYGDPAGLRRALTGVRRALLVTSRVAGEDDAAFLDAAREAGVQHVVKLSAAAVTDPGAQDAITRWQRACESALTSSPLGWTLLRPRSFMSNALSWAPSVRGENLVRALYGHSPNACVDPRDIAEVAVRALTGDGHSGRAYTLTGPHPLTAAQQTRQLAEALGRPLRFEELTPQQAREALLRRHPETVAQALLDSALRQRAGAKAQVLDTVQTVTGRAPRPFRVWARDHAQSFGPGAAAP
ncbi:SDR family oxidoreductase [Streptomyces sp. BV286]|uniref:SDR family oxidoreductase n=1 Tax=Streptomyces sp. BV286 TaxID=2849672 RepID=UPI001C2E5D66|nr:SDR family oxidoreductase [Streptomyces sp. BV286]MBV1940500.1 SDR family oxidoreductase [Streptomyces sp. BV286]